MTVPFEDMTIVQRIQQGVEFFQAGRKHRQGTTPEGLNTYGYGEITPDGSFEYPVPAWMIEGWPRAIVRKRRKDRKG